MGRTEEEEFEIVDEQDRVIGRAPRRLCHGDPRLVHRVAHVLVFARDGRLLLQKRAPHKDVQPGKWDTSVGGHLDIGESYLQAAYRELTEELGVSGIPLTYLYASRIRNAIESENVATYLACCDGPFRFSSVEIDAVRFWSAAEIETALGSGVLTPNFEEEWRLWCDWSRRYLTMSDRPLALCAGDSFPGLLAGLTGSSDTGR